MGTQQYCLKWNNHHGNLVNLFNNFLNDETFVDVTIACDGNSIKAHKLVLSACSPFFKDIFKQNPCKHPVVIIKDIQYCDLKTIISFMYEGEVNISQERLATLLKTAESLKIKGLIDMDGTKENADPDVGKKRKQSNTVQDSPVASKNVKSSSLAFKDSSVKATPAVVTPLPSQFNNNNKISSLHRNNKPSRNHKNLESYHRTDVNTNSSEASIQSSEGQFDEYILEPTSADMQAFDQTLTDNANYSGQIGKNKSYGIYNDQVGTSSTLHDNDNLHKSSVIDKIETEHVQMLDENINDRIKIEQPIEIDDDHEDDDDDDESVSAHNFMVEPGESYESISHSHDDTDMPSFYSQSSLLDYSQGEASADQSETVSGGRYSLLTGEEIRFSKNMVCQECGKHLSSRRALIRHIRHFHGSGAKQTYACDICKQLFQWKESYKKHRRKFHNFIE